MSNNQEEMRKLADAIELLQQSIQNTDSVSANPAIDSEHIRNLADALSMIGNLAPSSSVATDATDASDNTDSAQSADRMRSLADAIASLEQIEKKLDVVAAVPAVLPAPIVSVSVPIVQPAEVAPAPTVPVQEEPVAEIQVDVPAVQAEPTAPVAEVADAVVATIVATTPDAAVAVEVEVIQPDVAQEQIQEALEQIQEVKAELEHIEEKVQEVVSEQEVVAAVIEQAAANEEILTEQADNAEQFAVEKVEEANDAAEQAEQAIVAAEQTDDEVERQKLEELARQKEEERLEAENVAKLAEEEAERKRQEAAEEERKRIAAEAEQKRLAEEKEQLLREAAEQERISKEAEEAARTAVLAQHAEKTELKTMYDKELGKIKELKDSLATYSKLLEFRKNMSAKEFAQKLKDISANIISDEDQVVQQPLLAVVNGEEHIEVTPEEVATAIPDDEEQQQHVETVQPAGEVAVVVNQDEPVELDNQQEMPGEEPVFVSVPVEIVEEQQQPVASEVSAPVVVEQNVVETAVPVPEGDEHNAEDLKKDLTNEDVEANNEDKPVIQEVVPTEEQHATTADSFWTGPVVDSLESHSRTSSMTAERESNGRTDSTEEIVDEPQERIRNKAEKDARIAAKQKVKEEQEEAERKHAFEDVQQQLVDIGLAYRAGDEVRYYYEPLNTPEQYVNDYIDRNAQRQDVLNRAQVLNDPNLIRLARLSVILGNNLGMESNSDNLNTAKTLLSIQIESMKDNDTRDQSIVLFDRWQHAKVIYDNAYQSMLKSTQIAHDIKKTYINVIQAKMLETLDECIAFVVDSLLKQTIAEAQEAERQRKEAEEVAQTAFLVAQEAERQRIATIENRFSQIGSQLGELLRDANLKVAEVTDLLKELEQQYEILSDPSIKNETIAQIFMLSASELSNRNNRLDNIHDLVRKFNENGLAAQVQPLDGVSKQLDLGTKNDIQMNKPWGVAKMLPQAEYANADSIQNDINAIENVAVDMAKLYGKMLESFSGRDGLDLDELKRASNLRVLDVEARAVELALNVIDIEVLQNQIPPSVTGAGEAGGYASDNEDDKQQVFVEEEEEHVSENMLPAETVYYYPVYTADQSVQSLIAALQQIGNFLPPQEQGTAVQLFGSSPDKDALLADQNLKALIEFKTLKPTENGVNGVPIDGRIEISTIWVLDSHLTLDVEESVPTTGKIGSEVDVDMKSIQDAHLDEEEDVEAKEDEQAPVTPSIADSKLESTVDESLDSNGWTRSTVDVDQSVVPTEEEQPTSSKKLFLYLVNTPSKSPELLAQILDYISSNGLLPANDVYNDTNVQLFFGDIADILTTAATVEDTQSKAALLLEAEPAMFISNPNGNSTRANLQAPVKIDNTLIRDIIVFDNKLEWQGSADEKFMSDLKRSLASKHVPIVWASNMNEQPEPAISEVTTVADTPQPPANSTMSEERLPEPEKSEYSGPVDASELDDYTLLPNSGVIAQMTSAHGDTHDIINHDVVVQEKREKPKSIAEYINQGLLNAIQKKQQDEYIFGFPVQADKDLTLYYQVRSQDGQSARQRLQHILDEQSIKPKVSGPQGTSKKSKEIYQNSIKVIVTTKVKENPQSHLISIDSKNDKSGNFPIGSLYDRVIEFSDRYQDDTYEGIDDNIKNCITLELVITKDAIAEMNKYVKTFTGLSGNVTNFYQRGHQVYSILPVLVNAETIERIIAHRACFQTTSQFPRNEYRGYDVDDSELEDDSGVVTKAINALNDATDMFAGGMTNESTTPAARRERAKAARLFNEDQARLAADNEDDEWVQRL